MIPEKPVIVVDDLVKTFGDFTAVRNVNFHVNQGEIFGFLGPNGSGKTTTIRMMLGLLAPTAGRVQVLDFPVTENPRAIRSSVGYMSQHFSLYNDLTVEQNLRFYGTAYGLDNDLLRERMQAAVALAGLTGRESVKTETLSGGWRQRLALSAAILHEPKVLFLDEPTAGVDPVSRREFWELLYKLVEEGVTVFVTTHYMDEAEHCHRLAFIQHGALIAVGSPGTIKETMMRGRVFEIQPDETAKAVEILRAAKDDPHHPVSAVELYGSFIHAIVQDEKTQAEDIARIFEHHDLGVASIREVDPSLEDVFIACMREGA